MPKIKALVEAEFIEAHLKGKEELIAEELSDLVTEVANIYQANIKREAPVNKQKGGPSAGTLQSSIRVEHEGDFKAKVFQDGNLAPYAKIILRGRGKVVPKTKKALFWPGLKHPVKSSGPVKANPFWDRGVKNSKGEVNAEIERFKKIIIG